MNRIASKAHELAVVPKLIFFAAAFAALAPAAFAQTAAPAQGGAAESSGPVVQDSVQEVVVTAQRRPERLEDVPAAITALSGTQLQMMNITESNQLTQVTPGLNFTQSQYSPQPTIRGIGSRGVDAGEESEVPIYVDGIYQSFLPAAIMQLNDVERIEVLKGPQGALLGRNAMGGAINIITRTPTADPQADVSVSYGSYNQVIAKGYVSGGTDLIAGGLAVALNRDDGYIDDMVTRQKYGQTDDVSVHGKVLIHPGSNVDVTLAAGRTNDDTSTGEAFRNLGGNTVGAFVPGNIIATAPFSAALSFAPYNNSIQTTASVTAVFHLDGFDLTALSGYQDSKIAILTDGDATPLALATFYNVQTSRNEYNELYATSHSGPFNWIGGLVYYHDVSGNPPYIDIDLNIPPTPPVELQTEDRVATNSLAAYLQGTYQFTPQWSATVAGRYTRESKSFSNVNGVAGIPDSFVPLANSATFSKFTPSGTLQYQPIDRLNLYAKAGRAFKSGVFNTGATDELEAQPVQPETLTQYEIGLKADVSSRVTLNLASYYTDYTNLQSAARTPQNQSFLQNAGRATIYGFEAEAFVSPIDNLNLSAGVSGLHGTYGDFTNADVYFPATAVPAARPCSAGTGALIGGNVEETCNVDGKFIMRAPKITANLGGNYTVPMHSGDITLSGNVYYQGVSYWDTADVFEERPYTVVNARIAWRSPDKKYGVALWGENLGKSIYSETELIGALGTAQVLAKPRTYGVEVNASW